MLRPLNHIPYRLQVLQIYIKFCYILNNSHNIETSKTSDTLKNTFFCHRNIAYLVNMSLVIILYIIKKFQIIGTFSQKKSVKHGYKIVLSIHIMLFALTQKNGQLYHMIPLGYLLQLNYSSLLKYLCAILNYFFSKIKINNFVYE